LLSVYLGLEKGIKMDDKKIKILIVDDHPIVRQGLKLLLEQEAGMQVCGEAEDGEKAMAAIEENKPDFLILDVSLKGTDGIELSKNIRSLYPELPILVLSMHDESLLAERALRAGANGYLMKQEGTDKVIDAVHKIMGGKLYLSENMIETLLQKFIHGNASPENEPLQQLSDRELSVFELVGQGIGTKQIAEKLNLSSKTIETYRENIKKKLNLKNYIELIKHAAQWVENETRN
jgi:DNA-binding NarL/FixJ family response regulator